MKQLFYYTSISALFAKSGETLTKIENTLQVFSEHKGEVSVFWYQDPHLAKLRDRKPEIFAKYEDLTSRFQERGYGTIERDGEEDRIFRRETEGKPFLKITPTPTESRGIERCDAYYGSPGYLAQCFAEAGKPVMIQDLTISNEE